MARQAAIGAAPVFFTVVARNYLAHARVLMASLARHHPDSPRVVVLCDEPAAGVAAGLDAAVLPVRALRIEGFRAMAFGYDVMELSTAVKPHAFLHLLARHPGRPVVFLDPDIWVMDRLQPVEAAFAAGAELVLTPHITVPLEDGRHPDDLSIMKSGVHNLGFCAVRMAPDTDALLRWWARRCRRDAVVDIAGHRFTDQRWMDLAPSFVARTHLLRDPGCNLAYWNLPHRRVEAGRGDGVRVDGQALRFVHFSGVDPGDGRVFSRHQDRFTPDGLGALRPVFERYVAALQAAGWEECRRAPYAFGTFASGRRVHPAMRLAFRADEAAFGANPFAGGGAAFDAAEPGGDAPGVTAVAVALWRGRADLQRAFDLGTDAGRSGFAQWCVAHGAAAGLDTASVQAVEALRAGAAGAAAPWFVAEDGFAGPARELDGWLAGPVAPLPPLDRAGIPVPRLLALAWNSRADLQAHFRTENEAGLLDYLRWCLTNGLAEGSTDAALMEPALAAWLDMVELPASGEAPPVTRAMRLFAPVCDGPFRHAGPATAEGRLGTALWVLGAAARHGWPASFTRHLRSWADGVPAELAARGGLPLPRLLHALWRLRTDVQAVADLRTAEGQARFVAWVIRDGMREMGLPLAVLPAAFCRVLAGGAAGAPGCTTLHVLLWAGHPALRTGPHPRTAAGLAALADALGHDAWGHAAWLARLAPPSRPRARAARAAPRVLLTGMPDSPSGRGEDVRMTAAALGAQGVPYAVLDRTTGRLLDAGGRALDPAAARFDINIVHLNAETALADHLFLRRVLGPGPRPHTVGFWAWELPHVPDRWHWAFGACDEMWASSRFAYDAFAAASSRPVHHLSMPVRVPQPDPTLRRADFGIPDNRFAFLFGFDFASFVRRKNPEAAVAAFRRAFPTGDEPAVLVLKSMNGDRHADALAALQALAEGDGRILVLDRVLTAAENASLLELCDAYVSLHRAEGFGRGPAEAMRLGKPVIATNWSGNTDFTTARTAFLAFHTLVPVRDGEYPGWEDQHWAEPDIGQAARLMRGVFDDPAAARRIGAAARRHMARHYGVEVVGRGYARRIAAIRAALAQDPGVSERRRRPAAGLAGP